MATITYNDYYASEIIPPKFAGGGTQTEGGKCFSNDASCVPGNFGVSVGKKNGIDFGGFGGGGYYSGASYHGMGNGGGGSSFISGYPGCNAISESSTDFNNIIHTGQNTHFSGYVFFDMSMKSGNVTKYTSSGKAIITIISSMITSIKIIRIKLPIFLPFLQS